MLKKSAGIPIPRHIGKIYLRRSNLAFDAGFNGPIFDFSIALRILQITHIVPKKLNQINEYLVIRCKII